jgi:outer membrane lipoprotein carrier protein
MVEPDLEQAIIKRIDSNFDFFSLLSTAKKINDNKYIARYNNTTFFIIIDNSKIKSILYKDEFDNNVKIDFTNQIENKKMNKKAFEPIIPEDYDIIRN